MRTLVALAFSLLATASFVDQEIISPPAMAQDLFPAFNPVTTTKPSLTDLLTIEPSASIYFSYLRETEYVEKFSAVGPQPGWTLLVPTNKAVMALPRKPHQGNPRDEPEVEMSEELYDRQSKLNVERWITAHIIPTRISLSDAPVTYDTLLDGNSVTFTPVQGGKNVPQWLKVTVGDGVHITGMKEGENGVIYMIDGTVAPS